MQRSLLAILDITAPHKAGQFRQAVPVPRCDVGRMRESAALGATNSTRYFRDDGRLPIMMSVRSRQEAGCFLRAMFVFFVVEYWFFVHCGWVTARHGRSCFPEMRCRGGSSAPAFTGRHTILVVYDMLGDKSFKMALCGWKYPRG